MAWLWTDHTSVAEAEEITDFAKKILAALLQSAVEIFKRMFI
jgi:ribulose kinase